MIKIILFRIGEDGERKQVDMIDEHDILGPIVEFLTLHFSDEYMFDIKTTVQRVSKTRKEREKKKGDVS